MINNFSLFSIPLTPSTPSTQQAPKIVLQNARILLNKLTDAQVAQKTGNKLNNKILTSVNRVSKPKQASLISSLEAAKAVQKVVNVNTPSSSRTITKIPSKIALSHDPAQFTARGKLFFNKNSSSEPAKAAQSKSRTTATATNTFGSQLTQNLLETSDEIYVDAFNVPIQKPKSGFELRNEAYEAACKAHNLVEPGMSF